MLRQRHGMRAAGACVLALALIGSFSSGSLGAEREPAPALESGAVPVSTEAQSVSAADAGIDLPYKYISVGWIDWATVQLKEISENRPTALQAHLVLGMAYEALGNRSAALTAYKRAAAAGRGIDGVEGSALALAGSLLLKEGRIQEAETLLDKADAIDPESAVILFGLGRLAERKGDEELALDRYIKATEISPDWVEPVLRAGALLNERGAFARAAQLFSDALPLGSRHAEFHYQMALSYAGLLERIMADSPSSVDEDMLASLGIEGADPAQRIKELALHSVDRVNQLSPGHAGASRLLRRLQAM